MQIIMVLLPSVKPPDINRPQIFLRISLRHPLCQCLTGTTGAGNTHRVHPGGNEEIFNSRNLAQHIGRIRSKAFWNRGQAVDFGIVKGRYAFDAIDHENFKLIPVFLQLRIHKIFRNALGTPGLGNRLESAQKQSTHFLFDINISVHISQIGHSFIGTLNRIGGHVHMFSRIQGQADTDHLPDLARPHPGTVHQIFTGDIALVGTHTGDLF